MNIKTIRMLAFALAALTSAAAHAESSFQTGAGALTASARLDFQITIPKILYIRVGTGTAMAANAGIDLISFTVPAANIGNNTAVAATAGSGDLGNGTVTAQVIGNNGAITFTSTTTGPLNNGSGDTISYGQITTTVAASTSTPSLTAPALVDGTTTSVALTPNIGTKVTNLDAKWTYTYKNQAIVPPGTYGGVNTNGGRVTYTASMP
jgi:hypothetical protein